MVDRGGEDARRIDTPAGKITVTYTEQECLYFSCQLSVNPRTTHFFVGSKGRITKRNHGRSTKSLRAPCIPTSDCCSLGISSVCCWMDASGSRNPRKTLGRFRSSTASLAKKRPFAAPADQTPKGHSSYRVNLCGNGS